MFSFLDFLASVNIHVIKIITWTLTDVWHINFSSDPTDILLCVRIGIGYKSIVILKFYAQPMHFPFFQVWKKSLPIKILSSFALTAQPHQNITNRSLFPHTPSSILLAYYGHGISNMVYMPQIFHFPD